MLEKVLAYTTSPENTFSSRALSPSVCGPSGAPLNLVMYDVDADLKTARQLFDGQFFRPVQHGGGNAVAVANPVDHTLGERLTFGAAQRG